MVDRPRDFVEFKTTIQAVLDGNERILDSSGKTSEVQLKTYIVESSASVSTATSAIGRPHGLDTEGWYALERPGLSEFLVLDASDTRVWRLFSLLSAAESDQVVESWIARVSGLDHCWLSRHQLLRWINQPGWRQRGVGLHFNDGLASEDESGNFSLKAWHGAQTLVPGLDQLLHTAQETFAISSVRWQRVSNGETSLMAECYSNGKITFNRATDVDETLTFSSALAHRYRASLAEANELRASTMAPFEFQFSQPVNLDAFGEAVGRGRFPMRLWLAEVEHKPDFRRYRGVDMHTWDRVFLDIAPSYAYLTIPSDGCVNAAPRIATVQGEDNSGKTNIYFDGVEMFV